MKKHYTPLRATLTVLALCIGMLSRAQDAAEPAAEQYVEKTSPTVYHAMTNRRVLAGPYCTVNSVMDGIKVVTVPTDLQNLVDDNLDNYATIDAGVSATLAAPVPLVAIRDLKRYYTGGTEAGFAICSAKSFKVLGLSIVNLFQVWFYRDNRCVAKVSPSQGQAGSGLNLSLLGLPGSGNVTHEIVAVAPQNEEDDATVPLLFDEVRLVQCSGVNLELVSAFNIKYAFAGKPREYLLNKQGMQAYAQSCGKTFGTDTKTAHDDPNHLTHTATDPYYNPNADWVYSTYGTVTDANQDYFSNDNLTDGGALIGAVISTTAYLGVRIKTRDGKEPFPAGLQVGFNYTVKSGVELNLGNFGNHIRFWDQTNAFKSSGYHEIKDVNDGGGVLDLKVGDVHDGTTLVTFDQPFSGVDFRSIAVGLNLGAVHLKSGFIRFAPDIDHHCQLNITASQQMCGCDAQFTLQADVPVLWYKQQPDGSWGTALNATASTTCTYVFTPQDEKQTLTFKAEYPGCPKIEKCFETTTITWGASGYNPQTSTANFLYLMNYGSPRKYRDGTVSTSGNLLTVAGAMQGTGALVTPTLHDYAYRNPGVKLIGDDALVGVRRIDGESMSKAEDVPFSDNPKRVGFIVSSGTQVIDAQLLDFFNLRFYKWDAAAKKYVKVEQQVEQGWDVLSATIGSARKKGTRRIFATVPDSLDFDMVELCASGVLSADLSQQLIIYAAYMENADVTATDKKLKNDLLISTESTNASIDFANSTIVSIADVGNGITNISNLIDPHLGDNTGDGLNSETTFPAGVQVGGATLAVNLGRTVKAGQQIVLIMKNFKAGLGLNVANVMQVETYRRQADNTYVKKQMQNDWDIIKADVIGASEYQQVAMTLSDDCDQIRIMPIQTVSALNAPQIYGIVVRSDVNHDGTPDELDPSPCEDMDLVLEEKVGFKKSRDYNNCTLTFRRQLTAGNWSPIVLPVNLTKSQFEEMFGAEAKLSRLSNLTKVNGRNIIQFTSVRDNDENGVFMKQNIPYILKVTETADPAERYQAYDENNKIVEGPYYQTFRASEGGVHCTPESRDGTYDKVDLGLVENPSPDFWYVTYYGTWGTVDENNEYTYLTEIPVGAYYFSKGEMSYHNTADKHLYTPSYRGYITTTVASWWDQGQGSQGSGAKATLAGFASDDESTTTYIQVIEDNVTAPWANVYDLSGRKVDPRAAAPGIYIEHGRKTIKR